MGQPAGLAFILIIPKGQNYFCLVTVMVPAAEQMLIKDVLKEGLQGLRPVSSRLVI